MAKLEHFDDLRRALDVPDGVLVQLLAVSATAIMQPLNLLKIRRWTVTFMVGRIHDVISGHLNQVALQILPTHSSDHLS